ncbi:MAG: GHKL domain-containing protein [Acetatifactor sp.]|nr:GHKL domain-containing protein [Acetatifactor sp.]
MIVWIASFLTGVLNYYIVYRWIIRVPFRRNVKVVAGVIGVACLLVSAMYFSGAIAFKGPSIIIVSVLTIVILVKENRVSALLLSPIVFFVPGVVNIFCSYLLTFVLKIPYQAFMDSDLWSLVTQLSFPLLFFTLSLFFKGMLAEGEMMKFGVGQYLIALVGAGCLFVIIAVSQGVMEGKTQFSDWTLQLSVCWVVVGFIFVILILWHSSIEKRALQYKMENEYYQLALRRQEEHIKEIVESDEKIRRFRHDVNAHLTALEQCIQTNDLQQLKSYVERMRAETKKFEVQRFTGVGAVDAIISEWYQKALEEDVQWEWDGGFLGHTELEVYDLCVIFSNLLSNAVEATRQVEEGKEKKILISCGTFRDRICIRISNTCRQDLEAKSHYGTMKSDFRNHGFGLMNIQNTVDKVHGEFHKSVGQGVFSVEIIL